MAVDIWIRAEQLASEIEASHGGNVAPSGRDAEVIETLRAAARALARAELDRLVIEAKDEQLARQTEMLQAIGYPLLQVQTGVLCVPLIGPIDYERAHELMEVMLQGAIKWSARHVVIDLTGAIVSDPDVVRCLTDVVKALSLVGVHVALSGIRAEVARVLVEGNASLPNVSTYPTLAAALRTIGNRKRVTA
jgi:rsbT co-antagonist protein RsbR